MRKEACIVSSNTYGLATCPDWSPCDEKTSKRREDDASERPLWSGAPSLPAPPAVGARVFAKGGFGPSVVVGYFVEHVYLGLELQPDARPEWHLLQNPGRELVLVFGAEVRAITEEDERAEPVVSPAAVACPACGAEVSEECCLAKGRWHVKRKADAALLSRRILEQRMKGLVTS